MQEKQVLNFADKFSPYPGSSLRSYGDYSGEEFREDILAGLLRAAIEHGGIVEINFEGTMGLSSAFSREAFGGLVSKDGFTAAQLRGHMIFIENDPASRVYAQEAWGYIESANPQSAAALVH